jgi:hypothetical protein
MGGSAGIFREAQRFRRGLFNFNKVFTAEQPNVAASRTATGNGLADMLLGWSSNTTVGNQLARTRSRRTGACTSRTTGSCRAG